MLQNRWRTRFYVIQSFLSLDRFPTVANESCLPARALRKGPYQLLPTAAAPFRTRVWQVGFVVDKVALGQDFSKYFGFSCQSSFHQILHHHHNHPGQVQLAIQWPTCRVDSVPRPTMRIKKKSYEAPHYAVFSNLLLFHFAAYFISYTTEFETKLSSLMEQLEIVKGNWHTYLILWRI
jgi:hypothetical protein